MGLNQSIYTVLLGLRRRPLAGRLRDFLATLAKRAPMRIHYDFRMPEQ